MEKFQTFIQLTRLNKPIGFLLLFWPCAWGLSLGYYFNNTNYIFFKYMIFFLGSVLMRSAGCIFNDIVDRDLDKKLKEQKKTNCYWKNFNYRIFYLYNFLCLLALLILLQFNFLTIILGFGSMFLAFSLSFYEKNYLLASTFFRINI